MKKFLSLILTMLFGVIASIGQTPTGSLSGVISSADGVLPNATVEVKFNSTGKTQTAVTDGAGAFAFVQLQPGDYTVSVTASGFKTFVATDVKVDIGREYSLNRTLDIGTVQETVTVTAGADVITSTSAQVTNVVSPQQILSLPLITRSPLSLTTLQAGVQSNPFQNTSINGQRTTATNITRDGISINDPFIRANATDFAPGRPSVDDTGEFTISTTNQEADLGSGGAQITLVTPRGTSEFHGALFAFNRNSAFEANNFFRNRTGTPLSFRNRNQYGGKVGGPFPTPRFGEGGPSIDRNKGFFFFAYEGIKDPRSVIGTRTILTPSARAGAFNFTRAAAGSPVNANGVSCPSGTVGSTCTITNVLAFANSQGLTGIPTTIDPVIAARVIGNSPATGNFSSLGDGLNTTGFQLNRAMNTELNTYTFRGDVDITQKDSVSGTYSWNREDVLRPDVDGATFTASPNVTQFAENEQITLSYRRIFANNIVNEFRWGRFKNNVVFDRISGSPSFLLQTPGTTSGTLAGGLITNPEDIFQDQGRINRVTTLANNLNWIVGKHSLKFGGQYQKYEVASFNDAFIIPGYNLALPSATGSLVTTSPGFANVGGAANTSLINTAQVTTANNLIALLGGITNRGTQSFNQADINSPFQPIRQLAPFTNWNHALFASDRWSAARGLTITGGVRWELFPPLRLDSGLALEPIINDPNNPTSLLGNGSFNVVGTNAGQEFRFYNFDLNNFAPSFGVAWSPNFETGIGRFIFGSEGKSVIRGGYSQAYFNDSIITTLNNTLTSGGTGNFGLGRTTSLAVSASGNTEINDRVSGSLTPILPPGTAVLPRSFLQNNTATQGFFGNAGAINPDLQNPLNHQYSVGYQREFFGNTAFEIRYVGTSSYNLARGVNLNQIDVVNNGFLADFQRAQSNFAVTRAINPATATAFCNPTTVAGCQALTLFRSGTTGTGPLVVGTALSLAAFNTNLQNGTVADLAHSFVTLNLNNHPTVALPTRAPFVNFYANPNIGQIEYFTNDGFYNYNSLQFEVRRRFSKGIYLQGNYTFSKNLTNTIGTSQNNFEPFLQNQDRDLDLQRADFDQTHTLNFNGIYQLPFGKGKPFLNEGSLLDKFVGGWEITGLFQWGTGSPITFVDGLGTLNRGTFSGRQTPNSSLTNEQIRALTGVFEANGQIYFINPSIINTTGRASEGGINPANTNTTFAGQVFFNVPAGSTSGIGRTLINGPRTYNVNTAVLKNIRFGETVRVQLRGEAFNLFNNTNFFNNTQFSNIRSTTFGQITSAGAARVLQFAFRFEF